MISKLINNILTIYIDKIYHGYILDVWLSVQGAKQGGMTIKDHVIFVAILIPLLQMLIKPRG